MRRWQAGILLAALTAGILLAQPVVYPPVKPATLDGTGRVPVGQLGAGTADSTVFLRGDRAWAAPPGGGGGDAVTVNGAAVVDVDLDNATPAAPSGNLNILWQKDASSPANVSGYVNVSVLEPLMTLGNLAGTIGTSKITDANVTYAKIQNVTATNRVLGRSTAGAGVVEEITVGGDLSQAGSAFSVVANAITYAKMQDVSATSRFLGRITAGAGDTEELTGTQATTLLDAFTSALKGLVPASGGGTTNFLRADGTWAAPPGGGGGINTLRTTANQTINAGAGVYVDITGLTFPVVAGTRYAFEFHIVFQSAATATGWRAGVNAPAGTLNFFQTDQTVANASAGVATWLQRHNTVRNDMTLLATTVTAGVDLVVMIQGRYLCTANGTFAARFANELAANTDVTVREGSWGTWF